MSLKFFHLFFITIAFLLAVFCAWWGFTAHAAPGFSYSCAGAAVALLLYGAWYVRKSRGLII